MKKVLIFLLFAAFLTFNPTIVQAAKKFVPKNTGSAKTGGGGSAFPSIVKYRGDRLGIYLSFANFNGLDSVNYSFTYNTNGNPQGAGGTIRAGNNPTAQRELLFGTCSTGVCTYHYNLSGARLVLTAKYTSGRTYTKVYRIKTYQ